MISETTFIISDDQVQFIIFGVGFFIVLFFFTNIEMHTMPNFVNDNIYIYTVPFVDVNDDLNTNKNLNKTPLEAFTTEIYTNILDIETIFPYIFNIQINCLVVLIIIFLLFFSYLFFFHVYNFFFFFNLLKKYILLSLFYVDQLNFKMRHYFCSFLSILLLITSFNIIGLIPLNISFTAQLITNLNFTISIIIGLILIGFNLQGINFVKNFIPKNVPFIMIPFLFIIEVLSFFMRIFSMSIRLFSNMVAGHSLLHLLNEFTLYVIILATGNSILIFLTFIPLTISYFWLFFELFVAFLQAYVFILLYLLYLADVNKSH